MTKFTPVSCRKFIISLVPLFLRPSLIPAESINPFARPVVSQEQLLRWEFSQDLNGWQGIHHCEITAADGLLKITSTGTDPYLHSPDLNVAGPLVVKLDIKSAGAGPGQIFWRTQPSPDWSEDKSTLFTINHDDLRHDYEVNLPTTDLITQIRLDPGASAGQVEVEWIELTRKILHPLEITHLIQDANEIRLFLQNHSDKNLDFTMGAENFTIGPKENLTVPVDATGQDVFEAKTIVLNAPALGPIERTVFIYRPRGTARWVQRTSSRLTLRITPDGTGAELIIKGRVAAVLAPLVHYQGRVPPLKLIENDQALIFQAEGIKLELNLTEDELHIKIDSANECEGPVLRVLGNLEQGLFAGLEYLGKGESSSSRLDIETEEHLRFEPEIWKVTMPLMACVTDRAAAALTWQDMNLQPVFAVPNFFDGSSDHRMALRGKKIEAVIRIINGSLEDCILWAAKKHGLPNLPSPPRNWPDQRQLCLAAFNGPLKGPNGWGHCAEANWSRQPYADHASTIWRLTGQITQLDNIVPGGAHIPNDAIYFVTGRGQQWLDFKSGRISSIISQQQPDGSFRYTGKYQRGHFEDTAGGFCAQNAKELLEYAWITGDVQARQAGLKTLEFMKRFRTPRGAQTWELSLHTPDILASAYLVWAYVRGYELTGQDQYLGLARQWALAGVPFVYLWSRRPIMAYATIPVYGATNWQQPNWMGLPVQWCGTVYAYALLMLESYDQTLNWRQLAEGILIAAEQMQYTQGSAVGCLPDAFELKTQQPRPANINPCALVSLRLKLQGNLDSLAVAYDDKHRVAAPFKVTINNNQAHIDAQPGLNYQLLIDGNRIIDVSSQGQDVIVLE